MQLFEREREQASLLGALDGAAAGDGVFVWVEGAPGAGKSALLDWLRRTAVERGIEAVGASGAELERDLPFGLAQAVLGPLPEAGDLQGALLGAHLALGEREDPLAVLVDDAHWADDPSLRWLAFSGRRLAGLPVALVVASRPVPAWDGGLLTAAFEHAGVRMRLGPLGDAAVAAIAAARLGAGVDPAFASACGRLGAGNPLFVDALARAARDAGIPATRAGLAPLEGLCPPDVVELVTRRVARLGDAARRLAVAVAVLETAPLRRAAKLAGLDPDDATIAADELRAADVLAPGQTLGFAHPVGRAAVVEGLPPGERARLHRRAAGLLIDEDLPAAVVAGHVLASEPADDPRTVAVLEAAAGSAVRGGAPASAATLLRRAQDEPPPPDRRAAISAALGRVLLDVDPSSAVAPLTAALRAQDEPEEAAQLAIELARAHVTGGAVEAAVAVLERALAAAPRHPGSLRWRIEGELLGYERFADPAPGRRAEHLRRLEGVEEPLVGVHRALEAPTAAAGAGQLRAVWAHGSATPPDWSASPLPIWLTFGFIYCGALDDAAAVADAWARDARRAGAAVRVAYAEGVRAEIAFRGGDMRAAQDHASRAWEIAGETGPELAAWWTALAGLVQAHAGRGALEAAEALLRDTGFADHAPDLLLQPSVRAARAAWLDAAGRPGTAADELIAWGRWFSARFTVAGASTWRAEAAECLTRAGRSGEAVPLADAALADADRRADPIARGVALRAVALAGPRSERTSGLRASVDALAPTPARHEHARSLLALGAALRRDKRPRDARPPLREALDAFVRGGAERHAAHARTELRAAGGRPRRDQVTGADALTPSELRVARMAAVGRTNPEIAQELWITRKTVEKHLGGAFAKLAITRRQELAGALAWENGGEQE